MQATTSAGHPGIPATGPAALSGHNCLTRFLFRHRPTVRVAHVQRAVVPPGGVGDRLGRLRRAHLVRACPPAQCTARDRAARLRWRSRRWCTTSGSTARQSGPRGSSRSSPGRSRQGSPRSSRRSWGTRARTPGQAGAASVIPRLPCRAPAVAPARPPLSAGTPSRFRRARLRTSGGRTRRRRSPSWHRGQRNRSEHCEPDGRRDDCGHPPERHRPSVHEWLAHAFVSLFARALEPDRVATVARTGAVVPPRMSVWVARIERWPEHGQGVDPVTTSDELMLHARRDLEYVSWPRAPRACRRWPRRHRVPCNRSPC